MAFFVFDFGPAVRSGAVAALSAPAVADPIPVHNGCSCIPLQPEIDDYICAGGVNRLSSVPGCLQRCRAAATVDHPYKRNFGRAMLPGCLGLYSDVGKWRAVSKWGCAQNLERGRTWLRDLRLYAVCIHAQLRNGNIVRCCIEIQNAPFKEK